MEKATDVSHNGGISPQLLADLDPNDQLLVDGESRIWFVKAIERNKEGFVLTTLRPGTTCNEQIRWYRDIGFVDELFHPIPELNAPSTHIVYGN